MVFFLALLVGFLFAWIAVQVGFFATWIMFFNLLLGVYSAIFLTPVIVSLIPPSAIEMFGYGHGIIMLVVAIASSLMAYGMSYACLSGRLQLEFPKVFDNVGAGLLGFLAGFLVSSFFTFVVALTPISQTESLKPLGVEASSQGPNIAYFCWWCDRLHDFVSVSDSRLKSSREAVNFMLAKQGGAAGGAPAPGPGGPPSPANTMPPPDDLPPPPDAPPPHDGASPTTAGKTPPGMRKAPTERPSAPSAPPSNPFGP